MDLIVCRSVQDEDDTPSTYRFSLSAWSDEEDAQEEAMAEEEEEEEEEGANLTQQQEEATVAAHQALASGNAADMAFARGLVRQAFFPPNETASAKKARTE